MGRPEHSGSGFQENPVLTAPATDAARQWDGYGTALKPAWEPIIVAMKPCEGTLAQNALKWGVAGLAIDEARIECDGESLSGGGSTVGKKFENHHEGWARPWMADDDAREASRALRAEAEVHAELLGRWPANVLLDFESAAMPDEASGDLSSGFMSAGTPRNNRAGYNGAMPPNTAALEIYGDSRGASRYFYVAKADSAERHAGGKNQHPCVKPVDL